MAATSVGLLLWPFICIVISLVAGDDPACRHTGFYFYNGRCYGFGEDAITWADAQEVCQVFNGRLAEVYDANTNEYLKNLTKTTVDETVWLGGTDILTEGLWYWIGTGQQIYPFTDWAPGEPNQSGSTSSGGEDCLEFYKGKNYQWNDENCETKNFFICETEPIDVVG